MTTDIVKVTEEEFDEEGRLTRRTVTEYKEPFARGGYLPPWPDYRITPYNGANAKLREHVDTSRVVIGV